MAKARITLTIEREMPYTGSGAVDDGHVAYDLKQQIESMDLRGQARVVEIKIEQTFE